jgi:hypothetical protein
MTKRFWSNAIVFAALVGLIVVGRYLPHIANFTPVAAAGLFAGYHFRSKWIAMSVPFAGMLLSDLLFAGQYNLGVMAIVYIAIASPALLGGWLRKPAANSWQHGLKVALGAGGGAITFFLSTNFADWLFSGMYAQNLNGLVACYTAAIPFFQWTLAGDLCFAALLFGLHALYMRSQAKQAIALAA